jgi:hypothetical protein
MLAILHKYVVCQVFFGKIYNETQLLRIKI